MGDAIHYCDKCENHVGCHMNRGCVRDRDAHDPLDAAACSPLVDDGLVMVRCWYCDAGCDHCNNTGYLRTDRETAGLPPLDTTKGELMRACDIIGASLKKENVKVVPTSGADTGENSTVQK